MSERQTEEKREGEDTERAYREKNERVSNTETDRQTDRQTRDTDSTERERT